MGIVKEQKDAELRQLLFERMYDRLRAAQGEDPSIRLFNRPPIAFWASRYGSLLTVDRSAPERLIKITLELPPQPGPLEKDPWTASVFRTVDGARVALAGGVEGTVEDVVENMVRVFLDRTAPIE
jgi:hypothetical protein